MTLHKLPVMMLFHAQENVVFFYYTNFKEDGDPSLTPSPRSIASLPRFGPR